MTKTLSVGRKPGSATRSPFGGLFSRPMFEDLFNQLLIEGRDRTLNEFVNAAMDVAETDHTFEVKMDLPGIKADDVDIQIDNNTLTVRGQRMEETENKDDGDKQYHCVERCSGSFSRSVVLSSSINEDEASAEFKDGVLHIVIPKTDDAKPRKISIKS